MQTFRFKDLILGSETPENEREFSFDSQIEMKSFYVISVQQINWGLFSNQIAIPIHDTDYNQNLARFTASYIYGDLTQNTYRYSISGAIDIINNKLLINRSFSTDVSERNDYTLTVYIPQKYI